MERAFPTSVVDHRSPELGRWDRFRGNLLGTLIWVIFWLVIRTVRVEIVGWEHVLRARERAQTDGNVVSWAFWHGRQAIMLDHHKRDPVVILASLSRDGEIQTALLRRFGYYVTRGSSSRGGARGLIKMIRAARAGLEPGFAVDGPRGPRFAVKPGVMLLARKAGCGIIPVAGGAENPVVIKSWDRPIVPRPFGKAVLVYGEAVYVSRDASDEQLEEQRKLLEDRLNELTARADAYFGAAD